MNRWIKDDNGLYGRLSSVTRSGVNRHRLCISVSDTIKESRKVIELNQKLASFMDMRCKNGVRSNTNLFLWIRKMFALFKRNIT
jgi:hypothetical protein